MKATDVFFFFNLRVLFPVVSAAAGTVSKNTVGWKREATKRSRLLGRGRVRQSHGSATPNMPLLMLLQLYVVACVAGVTGESRQGGGEARHC